MATTKIAIDIDVNSEEGAKSLKQLKEEFKAITQELEKTKEGTEQYHNAIEKLATTRDDIKRLNEQINAQAGLGNKINTLANLGGTIASGFSAAQGAMALFGTESKEVEKTLLKVQAAMALAQGLRDLEGLADAFADAKQAISSMASGIVNYIKGIEGATAAQKIFNFIASLNPVGLIITAVAALGAGLAILTAKYKTTTEENDKLRASMEHSNNVINDQINANKSLIKMIDGVYGSEKKLKELKEENNKLTQEQIRNNFIVAAQLYAQTKSSIDAYKAQAGLLGTLTNSTNTVLHKMEEQLATSGREMLKLTEQFKSIKEEEINERLKGEGEIRKANDEAAKKAAEKEKIDREKRRQQELADSMMDIQQLKQVETTKNDELMKSTIDFEALRKQKQDELDAYYAQKKKERDERNKQFAISTAHETLQVIQDLTTAFAGKSKEAQHRAFNINKAASIANTTISTVESAQKAYASQLVVGDPTSPVRGAIAAALAVAAGVARVAAIAKTKFDEGGGGGSISVGGGGDIGTFNNNNLNNGVNNTSTNLSSVGNNQQQEPIKAYVVEHDVTSTQNMIKKIESKAKIE